MSFIQDAVATIAQRHELDEIVTQALHEALIADMHIAYATWNRRDPAPGRTLKVGIFARMRYRPGFQDLFKEAIVELDALLAQFVNERSRAA